ncbi:assembly of actin patch protein [Coniothyrium glycines]
MYKVKAIYDYASPHEDDLSFKAGQIIAVTEEEGDDWYVGEYTDDAGSRHDGLFPRNFVDKYEPEPPPRPNRASRLRPLEQPVEPAAPPTPTPAVPHQEPAPRPVDEPELPRAHAHAPPPLDVPAAAKAVPLPMSPTSPESAASARAPAPLPAQLEAPKPSPAAKKPPPPVAAKSNAFRDRIAAFNAPAAAPIQPFKPGGAPVNFVKKPFVAPPPSRNAYIPPVRDTPQVKTYRRVEDPEIAERQAQDNEAAERAGLVAHDAQQVHEGGEEQDQPKVSLKERIALLQKQQQEQAERAAAMHKEKPRRPPVKKRTESHEGHIEDSEDAGLERVTSGASRDRVSLDHARPRASHDAKREHHSDANDADQSGAGETEDAGGESTSVEDEEHRIPGHPPLPIRTAAAQEPETDDEQHVEEEGEEEDEMDAETRRKLELRERMAKMSGGMGMPGMFGAMPMGGLPPKKKKASVEKRTDEDEAQSIPQQRVAMFPMPGMPSVKSPEQEDRQLAVEKEEEVSHPVTGMYAADEVPDVEDVTFQAMQRTPTGERPPPVPADRRPVPPPVPSASRPVPPPLPQVTSPGPGSESGDEMTDDANAMSPRTPLAPSVPLTKRSSYFASDETVPASPLASRAPPPPPPTQAPPSRHGDPQPQTIDRIEGETDYEGDYDTDIASGATHKDALKSHARETSLEGHSVADEPLSARSIDAPQSIPPPPLHSLPRAVPPPPPHQAPSRTSTDAPRGAPPLPPVPPPTRALDHGDEDDEYDPFKYSGPPPPPAAAPPALRAVPPPPQSQPPPPQSRPPPPLPPSIPPVPQHQELDSSDEDDLYSAPAPRKSHDRPPPPPPPAPSYQPVPPPLPPQHHAPILPPQDRAPPAPPQERAAPPPPQAAPHAPPSDAPPRPTVGRKSLDANRVLGGRVSVDQSRPAANQDFIASDLDIGASSHWWAHSKRLPPSLQGRKDVLVEMKKAQSGNIVEKTIHVLYVDYSQTTISARFDVSNVSEVEFDQRHDPPPPRQRPDQLEGAYEQFGRQIAKAVELKQNSVVGNGTPFALIEELLRPHQDALQPVSTRAYGALVYANLANASTLSYDQIRPGDIISFRNAKFQGKTGPMHARYAADVGKPDHVGVVVEWDGSKKKVRAWEQGREHKKVKPESFKMGDLRSGEVRVWRVMSKSWVGWA